MSGSWQSLNNPAPFNIDRCCCSPRRRHVPRIRNPQLAQVRARQRLGLHQRHLAHLGPMPNNAPAGAERPADAPLYFASAVLRDGTGCSAPAASTTAAVPEPTADRRDLRSRDRCLDTDRDPAGLDEYWRCGVVRIAGRSGCCSATPTRTPDPTATAIWDPESGTGRPAGTVSIDSEEGWTLSARWHGARGAVHQRPERAEIRDRYQSVGRRRKHRPTLPENPSTCLRSYMRWAPDPVAGRPRVRDRASGHTALYTPPNTVPTIPGHGRRPGHSVERGRQANGRGRGPAWPAAERQRALRRRSDRDSGGDAGFATPTEFFEFPTQLR